MLEKLNLCRCFLRSKYSHCFLQIQIREFTPCGACSQEGKMFQFSMGTQANIQKIFDQPECMLCLARLCYECTVMVMVTVMARLCVWVLWVIYFKTWNGHVFLCPAGHLPSLGPRITADPKWHQISASKGFFASPWPFILRSDSNTASWSLDR